MTVALSAILMAVFVLLPNFNILYQNVDPNINVFETQDFVSSAYTREDMEFTFFDSHLIRFSYNEIGFNMLNQSLDLKTYM